jgi:hypothetical protein
MPDIALAAVPRFPGRQVEQPVKRHPTERLALGRAVHFDEEIAGLRGAH